ncbi:hypothetical protein [Bacillus subtilis]|uniref:hypothetical protein n=1 Tax=Bacillus subtilis TaxID=1423 RepID=UPI0018A7818C|nr:hypothetical protein [Bacillus subtilis]QPG33187.1 hypothetical protein ITP52_17600 [Bacillus subtilis]ULN55635.1 hypothetical protein MID01_15170 [Bacillus subtilis]WOA21219.1 hypothetical protein RW107_14710 [Bacillus subtilis]
MADKRVSIKSVHIDHGNDVVETIAVRDEGKAADILRAALASVEAPKHTVDFGNEKVNEVAAGGGSIADVLRTSFEQMNAKRDSKTEPTATLNVEVSEAITGLKALQREAKAATKALAELREEQAKVEIDSKAVDNRAARMMSSRKFAKGVR